MSALAADRRGAAVRLVMLYVVSVAAALLLSAVLVALTGGPWREVLSAFLDGAVRNPGRWGNTLTEAAPLLIVALGVIVSTKAGLVNIGQEGQVAIGAATAAFVAVNNSGPVALVFALLAGALGGAAWAGLAAVLKYWRKVPEVISTLLLVFLASQVVGYLLTRDSLLLDPNGGPNKLQNSAQVDTSTRIGMIRIFGNEFGWQVLAALGLAIGLGLVLARSIWGFRLHVLGRNARTAQRIGVPVVAMGAGALCIGGAFAGLAGATMLASGAANYRLTSGFSDNVGWEGLLVALVARNRPGACVPVALVFGALNTGAGFLAATGVERTIVDVVRGLLVMALLVPPAIAAIRRRQVSPPPAPAVGDEPVVKGALA